MKLFILFMSVLAMAEPKMEPLRTDTVPDVPESEYTYQHSRKRAANYGLGLVKPSSRDFIQPVPDARFKNADVKLPNSFHLNSLAKLSPVFDQGSCGSCVYNALMSAIQDQYLIAGLDQGILSRQHAMCLAPWSCNGSYAEQATNGVVKNGGVAKADVYPYLARDASCKSGFPLFGKTLKYIPIDNSFKSIATALYESKKPVLVTIGADGTYMNYDSGIYNACTNAGTNHQVLVEGYDCEGECKFDANGKLPAGVGFYHQRNSWGTWGEDGWIRIKATGKSGRLCNNIAEEAGVLDIGHEPAPSPTVSPTPSPTPEPIPPTPSYIPTWVYVIMGIMGAGIVVLTLILII